MASTTAPVKCILIGEHTVIYGSPAIAIPIQKITKVQLKPLRIKTSVPAGIGFGISASIAVAKVRAAYQLQNKKLTTQKLLQEAYKLESLSHGNPSGIDHTTIILNQPIWFQKNESKNIIIPMPQLMNKKILKNCYLINTGKPNESTKQMVRHVAKLFEKNHELKHKALNTITQACKNLQTSLSDNNEKLFMQTINIAGKMLEEIEISSPTTTKLAQQIRNLGGAAKVSGGGGRKKNSGLILVYIKNFTPLKKILTQNQLNYFTIIE